MISHRHRCIFVEVPKTGSTSIRQLLGEPRKPHLDICQIRDEMTRHWTGEGGVLSTLSAAAYELLPLKRRQARGQRQFEAYFKFGFVRNPWDRVVSLYLRREGLQLRDRMSFAEFVDWIRYASSTCIHPSPHTNQLDWLVDPSGELLVDFIGRFETLDADWAKVAQKIGLPIQLPHSNPNRDGRRPYTEYYDAAARDTIARKFAVDIEYFGYRFGD